MVGTIMLLCICLNEIWLEAVSNEAKIKMRWVVGFMRLTMSVTLLDKTRYLVWVAGGHDGGIVYMKLIPLLQFRHLK